MQRSKGKKKEEDYEKLCEKQEITGEMFVGTNSD